MTTPADGSDIQTRVQAVVEEFRVLTQSHGGDVEFVALQPDNTVQVRLMGACAGCPGATQTLKMGLERILRERVPEIAGVENVS